MQNKILEIKANNGDTQAQNEMASKYYYGIDVEVNYEKAFKFAKAAADAGLGTSQLLVGMMYAKGQGVAKDAKLAKEYQDKAKAQGVSAPKKTKVASAKPKSRKSLYIAILSLLIVGSIVASFCIEKSRTLIFANIGMSQSQYELASAYESAKMGFERNPKKAVEWYTFASKNDLDIAQLRLGKAYLYGEIGLRIERRIAKDWLRKSADLGNAEAQYTLAKVLFADKKRDLDLIISLYTKAAEQEHAESQYELAMCYYNAIGVEKDLTQAVDLLTKSAEQDNAEAQVVLADCYLNAIGVEQDLAKAIDLFTQSAEQENSDAQSALGSCYLNGVGVEKDLAKAIDLLNKSVEQENASAQATLGTCYLNGVGVEKNIEKAVELLYDSVKQDNTEAKYILGSYKLSTVDLSKDKKELDAEFAILDEAEELMIDAGKNGHLVAICSLGEHYNTHIVNKNLAKSVYWYEKAAQAGDLDSKLKVAKAYERGEGVDVDFEKAVELYTELAKTDNVDALLALGNALYNGNGASKDLYKAVDFYKKASELGNVQAQWLLGSLYANRIEIIDAKEAVKYFTQAAEQKFTPALYALGNCYYLGEGVEVDEEKAISLFEQAAELGDVLSTRKLDYIDLKNNPPEPYSRSEGSSL